jgi:NlpC/P60 family putative phage cell wall peptidase
MAPETAALQRARVVAAARGWIGTPYHHAAAIKGAGVDCAKLLIETFADAGLIERFAPEPYPPDWHLHRSEERYLAAIARFAAEFDWRAEGIRPGDVVVWKYGRTFSHGGVVTAWPFVVNALAGNKVVEETCVNGSDMDGRPMRAFSFWGR